MSGTGNNFSLIVGGASGDQVTLTGPTTGLRRTNGKPGVVLYQDPGTVANYGFDAEAGTPPPSPSTVSCTTRRCRLRGQRPLDYWTE